MFFYIKETENQKIFLKESYRTRKGVRLSYYKTSYVLNMKSERTHLYKKGKEVHK